jgi:hypothetical protein
VAGRFRRRSRNDRDLDRLAFLERLSHDVPGGGPPASAPPREVGANAAPVETGRSAAMVAVARYARFRQVAGLLFGLALLALLWALVAVIIAIGALLQGEISVFAGAARIVGWVFAATVGYGLLKGLAEALLLWADVAELSNTATELWWRRSSETPGRAPQGQP